MRTLVFDGRTGAAGDMICAALIAAGADPDALAPVSDRLPVRYEVGETTKNGIRATTVDVFVDDNGDSDNGRSHDHADDHAHDHSDGHAHDHADGHSYDHTDDHAYDHSDGHAHDHADLNHTHAEGVGVRRSYSEVVDLV